MLGLIIFVLFAMSALAAYLGERKGRNVWIVFLFTFFTGTGLPVAIYMGLFARKYEKKGAAAAAQDRIGALERLAQLHAAGSLSDAEFAAEKQRLISLS